MPYRFKVDEPVEKGFRRIAREQLEAALAELSASQILPAGVHECRKALKRLRALVRLASSDLGAAKARRHNKALGKAARLLSARRDQAVMLDTIAKLASDGGPDAALTVAPLRASLVAGTGEQPGPLDDDSASEARHILLREAKKFARIRFHQRGFAALHGGLEKSYGQARRALKNAYSEPTDDAFHSLRKAVQWHWRQMSLLGRAWPDEFAVRVSAARELSQMLGEDHDLAVLIAAATTADKMTAEQKEAVVGLCAGRQRALRQAVEFRAARLFAEKPKEFTKRMNAYWRFGRASDTRVDTPARNLAKPQRLQAAPNVEALPDLKSNGQDGQQSIPAKPRLAAKTSSAPSQRRA